MGLENVRARWGALTASLAAAIAARACPPCPACRRSLDKIASLPKEYWIADVTPCCVCAQCGVILFVTLSPLRVWLATPDEFIELPAQHRGALKRLQKLILSDDNPLHHQGE